MSMTPSNPRAKIHRPAGTAMQSGRAGGGAGGMPWVLEFPRRMAALPNSLMGWQSSGEVMHSIRMGFASADAAIAWAESRGMAYTVFHGDGAAGRGTRPRATNKKATRGQGIKRRLASYADNFAYNRRGGAWTH